jgi:hypothetical protein
MAGAFSDFRHPFGLHGGGGGRGKIPTNAQKANVAGRISKRSSRGGRPATCPLDTNIKHTILMHSANAWNPASFRFDEAWTAFRFVHQRNVRPVVTTRGRYSE